MRPLMALSDQTHRQVRNRWPAELCLLIDLTRGADDPKLSSVLAALDPSRLDWQRFIALAARHRVESLAAINLAGHASSPVPSAVRDHFAGRLRSNTVHSLTLARATAESIEKLQATGVTAILLKGQAVAGRFYSSLNARESIDIDLLVGTDAVGARAVIEGLGFRQAYPDFVVPSQCEGTFMALAGDVGYERGSDGVKLELVHGRLDRVEWSFERALRATTTMQIGATSVRVFEPVPQFLYLVCHGAKHAWFRLKWLADVYRVAGALTDEEVEKVARLAQASGANRMFAAGLQMLDVVYGIRIGERAGIAPETNAGRRLYQFMLSSFERPAAEDGVRVADLGRLFDETRYVLNLRSDFRYRRTALIKILTSVRDIRTIRLSQRWLWLYVLLGPLLAASRVARREIRARFAPTNP